MREMQIESPGREDPLEEEVAAHSSILAWEIPWSEAPGGLQPMGWQRVAHNSRLHLGKQVLWKGLWAGQAMGRKTGLCCTKVLWR